MEVVTDDRGVEQGAVVTAYTNNAQALAINSMVFTDRSVHTVGSNRWPIVTADAAEVGRRPDDFRFFGVAIGAPDHNYVAVAISGVCTVVCHNEDLQDSFPTDYIQADCTEQRQIPIYSGGGVFVTPKLEVPQQPADFDKDKAVGILLAHGRNPANEIRVLLLPGLSYTDIEMTQAVAPATAATGGAPAGPAATAAETFANNPNAALDAMTIGQLRGVNLGANMNFNTARALFTTQMQEFAASNAAQFQMAVE